MRILYCNKYDYPFSGTEAYLFDLVRRMDECGQETALFSMAHGRTKVFRRSRLPNSQNRFQGSLRQPDEKGPHGRARPLLTLGTPGDAQVRR